jgi:hypothetical protein
MRCPNKEAVVTRDGAIILSSACHQMQCNLEHFNFKVKCKNFKVSTEVHRLIRGKGKLGEHYGDMVERTMRHFASCPRAREDEEV